MLNQIISDICSAHSLIEKCAAAYPEHIAIIDENRALTYAELNHKANQLAHYLLTFGVKADTFIAISMTRSVELLISMLGILKAGCAYLPLDGTHPIERLTFILDDTNTSILITQSTFAEQFSTYEGKKIFLDTIWSEISTHATHNPSCESNSKNLAYAIYTSGSTGTPKGVLIEHGSLVNYIKWFGSYSSCASQDRIDFSTDYIFDMSITSTIAALALNLQVVICSDEIKRNIKQYIDYLNKNKINIIKQTPTYFKFMVQEINNHLVDLPDLRSIILGGENLQTADCVAWLNHYPKHYLFNEYGPTEATVAVTQYKITRENIQQLGSSVPIGKPGFNIECLLLNENKQPVCAGEAGELYVSGKCLARGYLNRPELNNTKFIRINGSDQRWYMTGDLCSYLPNGNIEFKHRIDDQIKIRGYRMESSEIEFFLTSHPLIKDAIVTTWEGLQDQKQLVAYYIPNDKTIIPSPNDLRHYLQQHLPDYMVPANFVMIEAFPFSANGKLNKKALPAPCYSADECATQSNTALEKEIINIWQKIFHLEKIDSTVNFFELGGHSLLAAQIISAIQEKFGKKITLKNFYNAPTIKQLASMIESAENYYRHDNSQTTPSNTIPLSDFQFLFWISRIFEPKVKELNIVTRRRLAKKLDISILNLAFESLLKKHEVLSYRISKLSPVQYFKNNLDTVHANAFRVIEKDLRSYSETARESELSASFDELINYSSWKKHSPLLVAKLFYLEDELSELQICTPHSVFDDASEHILYSELSNAYLIHKNAINQKNLLELIQYKDYVLHERAHLNQQIDRDIHFWENYLQDANLVSLPTSQISTDNTNSYSTYLELPEDSLKNIQNVCKSLRVNIADVVCASITLALKNIVGAINNEQVFINIIKSTRTNERFNQLIGCFISLDPIKVDINTNMNLIELSKYIQQSRMDTEPYQACSGMVKLACMNKNFHRKSIRRFLIHTASTLYTTIFKNSKINPTMLAMYIRLISLRKKNRFLINVNLLNNFISPPLDKNLFGSTIAETKTHQYNLSNIDNVLDICFFRNESLNKTYLVISGNLTESFRHQFGNEVKRGLG